MENEKQIIPGSLEDPDNPQRALSSLQRKQIPSNIRGKVIYIPWDRTKFVCQFHKVKMTVNMSDNAIRDKGNKMAEFECDCGVIYIRTQDMNKVSPEFRR